jgi:biopolymer transport protein ExbB/TolQ
MTVAFVVVAVVAVREHRDALHTIAHSSAKSVVAAQQIATSLEDMDANAANALLNPQQKQQSIKAYQESRKAMTDAMVDAAHNITFEPEEEQIKKLADESNDYGSRVESAFSLPTANGVALGKYLSAADLLDKRLMGRAVELDRINRDELDKSYRSIQTISVVQRGLVWIVGLAALGLLLRVQFFLSERMHRTLNPLCLAATLLTAGLLLYTNHAISTAFEKIEVVKTDAFDSIHSLWRAKAVAYEANARESRYLLDKQGAAADESRFMELSKMMASNTDQLAIVTQPGRVSKPAATLTGLLPDELRSISFPGEREAVVDAASNWLTYLKIDGQIRMLEGTGQHDKAVALCLGEEAGQSNWAFKGFIDSIEKALKINQDQFEMATEKGLEALQNFEIIAPLMGLLAALACLFGVLPRIREYSA